MKNLTIISGRVTINNSGISIHGVNNSDFKELKKLALENSLAEYLNLTGTELVRFMGTTFFKE